MDYDGDGLKDLLVSCPDRPYKGLYFFKNIGTPRHPRFAAAERISEKGMNNIRLSEADGKPYVLSKNFEYPDFFKAPYAKKRRLHYEGEELGATYNKSRSNMWSYADWDGDGDKDIVVGIDTWDDYGWDNAFDSLGRWTRGPLHGYVYLLENTGRGYVNRGKVEAAGAPIDVYGAPNPCIADFDGDGDPDLICGEFVDGLTWFENVGTRMEPRFAAGRPLANKHGEIRLHLEMIVPVVSDFDGDGHPDLIVGDEDGRVAWVRHTGKVKKGMPQFESPVYFTQQADPVKFGALSTPCAFDWDGDGKQDIIAGNSAGEIAFIRNLSGGENPVWDAPRLFTVNGKPIRIQAGENGSIQGPAERKWGYTVLSVADWDGDGLPDIIINSIWGKIEWFRNLGGKDGLRLAPAQPVRVAWEGEAPKPAWNWWTPEPGTLAHDARGDGLERRRADGPHRPRPGGLPRLLRTFPHARRRTAAPSRTPHLPRHELLALQLQKRGSECVGRASAAERRHRRTIRTPQDLLHGLGRRRTVGPDRGQPERLLVPQRPRGAGRGVVRIHGQRRRTHTGWSHDLSDPHRLAGRRHAGTPAGGRGRPLLPDGEPTETDAMKTYLTTLCALLLAVAVSQAAEPLHVKLFPEGTPTKSGLEEQPEGVNDKGYYVGVSDPELLVYLPDPARATGQAMLVVPGGSYEKVCITHEGYKTAEWLNEHGIAAMILKYRMPNGHPGIPLEDGEQAMRVIRRNAAQWGVDPHNVGIIGFSAGGHFASTLITEYTNEETRPDFAVLVYPVVSMNYSSVRTRENLLGARSEEEALRKRHSTFGQVHEGMPEVMLLLCNDDKAVVPDNSIAFYRALNRRGVKAEMHIYPEGGHGFWMRERYKYGDETYPAVIRWIERHRTNN